MTERAELVSLPWAGIPAREMGFFTKLPNSSTLPAVSQQDESRLTTPLSEQSQRHHPRSGKAQSVQAQTVRGFVCLFVCFVCFIW